MVNRIKYYTYEQATDLLEKLPANLDKVMDLGAGMRDSPISSQVAKIKCNQLISVESFDPYLEELLKVQARAERHDVVKFNIVNIPWNSMAFDKTDLIIMIDVIEHIEKSHALELIEKMKATTKRIILFTPEGDTIGYSNHHMDNPLQEHKSAWTPEEFEELGFQVVVYEDFHTHVKDKPIGAIWAIWDKK